MAVTINNINYTRTSKLGTGTPIPFVRKTGMSENAMNSIISSTSDSATLADAIGVFNGIEIDWNGADWDSVPASAPTSINTTSDLLKTIKYAANGEIFGKLMFAESLRKPHSSQRLAK